MNKLERLKKAEELGFKLIGPMFKDTFAYVQLQREMKELQSSGEKANE